jgi:hypothetical protein
VLANAKAQLLMALQDEDVGAVLGKKGQTLTQIQQVRDCILLHYLFAIWVFCNPLHWARRARR